METMEYLENETIQIAKPAETDFE